MSFNWANALLFQLTGSPPPASGRIAGNQRERERNRANGGDEPNYGRLFGPAMTLDRAWRIITLNMAQSENSPVSVSVDTGTGAQPQKRSQYLLNPETGAVLNRVAFLDGSLDRDYMHSLASDIRVNGEEWWGKRWLGSLHLGLACWSIRGYRSLLEGC